MRILYFDCFSGISGDMSLAALVDAGADRSYIESELKKIDIEPFSLNWEPVMKQGISALKCHVKAEHAGHHHRHYADIVNLIKEAGFNDNVTEMSLAIFKKIGEAEGKIHNLPLDQVHFHEVGAIDSIVDTVGVALAIDSLEVDEIYSSAIPLGSGRIRCDHGLYPVPAPATLEMMKGIPIKQSTLPYELTTPTGAGIVASLASDFGTLPNMIVESIGYGAGTRDLPNQPNVLRVIIGSKDDEIVHTVHSHGHHHHGEHEHLHEHHHEHTHRHKHEHGHAHEHKLAHAHDHGHTHGQKHVRSDEAQIDQQ